MKGKQKDRKPREAIGIDKNGNKRKIWLFPKDAGPDEIYWMIQDMIWKSREDKAFVEDKTLEQVVTEEKIRTSEYNGEVIDVKQEVENAMEKYKLLLEHRSEQSKITGNVR